MSKATTLQKTAEYIAMLQQERAAMQEEAQQLRDQIEELNAAIKYAGRGGGPVGAAGEGACRTTPQP